MPDEGLLNRAHRASRVEISDAEELGERLGNIQPAFDVRAGVRQLSTQVHFVLSHDIGLT